MGLLFIFYFFGLLILNHKKILRYFVQKKKSLDYIVGGDWMNEKERMETKIEEINLV
jgi:hypothetical protein